MYRIASERGTKRSVAKTALIVIDMLNAYEHVDADALTKSVERAVPAMVELIARAEDEGVPTIYVNDNFGAWTSDRRALLETALEGRHARLVEPIAPSEDALFVVKARHSIFFQTPLEYLLGQEGVDRVVLTGQVTEQCVLYSALDAYIRHLEVVIPRDAVAHIHEHLAEASLELMERNMGAEIVAASDVRF
jgi:nicotinamidase-related amidase